MGVQAKESRGRPQSPLVAANKTSWGEVTNSITHTIQGGKSIKLPLGEVYVRISWRDAAQ